MNRENCLKPSEETRIALTKGELPAWKRIPLERHIARCPDCAAAQTQVAATFARAQTLPLDRAGNALRDQIWSTAEGISLTPNAQPPTPSSRLFPFRIALGGLTAAAVTIFALAFLPGTPGHPTVVFAQVEKAMKELKTVHWRSRTLQTVELRPDGKYKILKPEGSGVTWVSLDPPMMAGVYGKDRMVYTPTTRYQIDDDPSGVTAYARFSQGFSEDGEEEPNTGKTPREILLNQVVFPREDIGNRQAKQWKKRGVDVRQTPWNATQVTLDGKNVLHFEQERRYAQDLSNDANFRWKDIGMKREVWADPQTFRIIKRMTTGSFTNGTETVEAISVSDDFRYDVTVPPGVFEHQPAVGARYSFRAFKERQARDEEEKAIRDLVNRAADAFNRQDGAAYADQWDFEYLNVPEERQAREKRLQIQSLASAKPARPWRIATIYKSSTRPTGIFVQETPETPFPPTEPNEFRTFLEIKDAQGKKWVWMLNVRKHANDFRLIRADFWPIPEKKRNNK